MLLAVVVLALPPAVWAVRIATDEQRFAAAVSALPRHRIIGRTVRRRTPYFVGPAVDRLLRTTAVDRLWRRCTLTAHRRVRRPVHRLGLVAAAAFATLSTAHGRWRSTAWLVGSLTLASTLRVIF